MSVSLLASAAAFTDIRWLSQAAGSGDTTSTDEINSVDQAPVGEASELLIPPLGSDDGAVSSGGAGGMLQFSADTMSALLATQGERDKAKALIAPFDADADSKVSQSEYQAVAGSDFDQAWIDLLFRKLDGDGDGAISQDELQTNLEKPSLDIGDLAFGSRQIPIDNSRRVYPVPSGASAAGTTSQTSIDADGSTTTTVTDLNGTKPDPTTPVTSSDSGSSGPRNYAADRAEALIASFDTDGDGKVSQSEYKIVNGQEVDQSQVDSVFGKYDVDGDGLISRGELQADRGDHGLGALVAFLPRTIRVSPVRSTEVTNNPDGTMTITHTLVDGTKRSITGRPTSRNSSGGIGYERALPEPAHFQSLLKSMVSRQAQLASPTTSLSI